MRHYVIDGNNLIGKISNLQKLQNKDKQSSREKLAFILERYFSSKNNIKVTLHFDGFPGSAIRIQNIKIIYSNNRIADDEIKLQIEHEKNPRNMIIISSDFNLKDFASKCGCDWKSCEDFSKDILNTNDEDEEKKKIDGIDNEEFKRLFNS